MIIFKDLYLETSDYIDNNGNICKNIHKILQTIYKKLNKNGHLYVIYYNKDKLNILSLVAEYFTIIENKNNIIIACKK